MKLILASATLSVLFVTSAAQGLSRLKDLANLIGARTNSLVGYGLVIGLNGSGDKGLDLTNASLAQALQTIGVDPKTPKFESKNVASVLVTATLPPFARHGSALDVTVASIGSASSLEGGTLLVTPLRGADNQVYAVAQGKIFTPQNTKREKSELTVEIPRAAVVEREWVAPWPEMKELEYHLHQADFTTSARIAFRINEELAGKYATANDAGTVKVILPYQYEKNPVEVIAQIESLEIDADTKAKVVVNPRTGTVVMGEHVRILPVAIAHAGMKISLKGKDKGAGAGAEDRKNGAIALPQTAAATNQTARVEDEKKVAAAETPPTAGEAPAAAAGKESGREIGFLDQGQGPSISELVSALNEMGVKADELIAILQTLRASGALLAEVEFL